MNLTHLRYIVEVERLGSITKAASALYMGQPNLSKAIKEIEREIGVPIFRRSAQGVVVTEKGRQFLQYAKAILVQMDKIENLYLTGEEDRVSFSLIMPRASYAAYAFTGVMKKLSDAGDIDVKLKETNSMDALTAVVECEYDMAIIRYAIENEEIFRDTIEEKDLAVHSEWQFRKQLIISEKSPLAGLEEIKESDLSGYIEVLHGDSTLPNTSTVYQRRSARAKASRKHISVYERGSQFCILDQCPGSYMWVSPLPEHVLRKHGLVQRRCEGIEKEFKDVLITQKSYRLSGTDRLFMEELERVRKELEENR